MVNPYKDLKMIKSLTGGWHSLSVELLEGNIVKKKIWKYFPMQLKAFRQEVLLLKHLRGCPFVPQLLYVDKKNTTIYMTYCGKKIKKTDESMKQISDILHALSEKWGVSRIDKNGKQIFQLGTTKNATILNKKLFIIDFGSHQWQITKSI